MRYLLLSVLVVCMIGVMIPSAFGIEKDFHEIIITSSQDDRFGYDLVVNDEKLFVIKDGGDGIYVYNSNDGSLEKTLLLESFSEPNWLGMGKIRLSGEHLFVSISLDPYFSDCNSGIAMINYNTGKLIHVFTDTELLAYESKNSHNSLGSVHILENKICSKNFGMGSHNSSGFEVFDNYLLVSATRDQGKYQDGETREYVQKPQVVLIDIDTKKILNIFEGINFELSPYSPDNYGNELFSLGSSDFGHALAINEKFVVIGDGSQTNGLVSIFDTQTGNLIKKIEGEKYNENAFAFGSTLTLSNNNLIIGQFGWDYGRVHQFELPSGELVRTIRAPTTFQTNFGATLTSNDDFFLVSAYDLTRYRALNGITENGIESLRGTTYMYDFASGELVKQFKNSSSRPGHVYNYNLWTDQFGHRTTISEKTIAITAKGFNDGAVFLYTSQLPEKNQKLETIPEPEPTPEPEIITSDIQKVPDWVRNIFIWYGEERISEDELLNAIKFLVNQGIIDLNE